MTQLLPASSDPIDLPNGHLQPSFFGLPPDCTLAFSWAVLWGVNPLSLSFPSSGVGA